MNPQRFGVYFLVATKGVIDGTGNLARLEPRFALI
jgi:hypothetical protein